MVALKSAICTLNRNAVILTLGVTLAFIAFNDNSNKYPSVYTYNSTLFVTFNFYALYVQREIIFIFNFLID